MLLAFITRRMVRSAHLALSPKHITAQLYFAAWNRYSYEKIHITSLGTARWAHLRTSHHHIKPSAKGSGLMWWFVLRWANLAVPTMPYAYIPEYIYKSTVKLLCFHSKLLVEYECPWVFVILMYRNVYLTTCVNTCVNLTERHVSSRLCCIIPCNYYQMIYHITSKY